MAIKIVLFLASILSLTVGAHLLFYKIVIRVFAITGPALKTLLLIVLLLLALSFMASFLLLQWQENPLTIGFYKFSAIWIGLFLHLLPAVLASWIIIVAIRFTGNSPPAEIDCHCMHCCGRFIFSLRGMECISPQDKKT